MIYFVKYFKNMGVIVITWDEKFKIGNELIDSQHKNLFELIESINDKYFLNKDELDNILGFLKEYTLEHFYYEERLLDELACNDTEKHKRQHDAFKDKVKLLEDRHDKEVNDLIDSEALEELSDYLYNWLANHIMVEDMKIKKYL